jgi:hypothetical protein
MDVQVQSLNRKSSLEILPDPILHDHSSKQSPISSDGGPSKAIGPSKMSVPPRDLEPAALARSIYDTARKLDDRPIDDTHYALLMKADVINAVVEQQLPHGRANVKTDLALTNNETLKMRIAASRFSTVAVEKELPSRADSAARGKYLGTGKCGEISSMSVREAGALLGDGESVQIRSTSDHEWAELKANGHRALVDRWCDGAAIDPTDGRFSRQRWSTSRELKIDKGSFAKFDKLYQERLAIMEKPESKALMRQEYDKFEKELAIAVELDLHLRSPKSTIDPKFAKRARERIEREAPPAPSGLAMVGKKLSRTKHKLLAGVGIGSDIRSRAREKVRLDKREAAGPTMSPAQWNDRVRQMARESALRAGAAPEQAEASIDTILAGVKTMHKPTPRDVRAPDLDQLMGPAKSQA